MSVELEAVALVVTTQELESGEDSDLYDEVDYEYENPFEDRPANLEQIGESHSDYVSDELDSDDDSEELDSDDDSVELDSDDDLDELDSDDDSDDMDSEDSEYAAEDDIVGAAHYDQGPAQELSLTAIANMLMGAEFLGGRNF